MYLTQLYFNQLYLTQAHQAALYAQCTPSLASAYSCPQSVALHTCLMPSTTTSSTTLIPDNHPPHCCTQQHTCSHIIPHMHACLQPYKHHCNCPMNTTCHTATGLALSH